ncbi:hypothetical protein ACQKQC_06610 [Vibrio fortis]|uniref:hypothetical protein n=1 Tax=Vibrio fortis TaxID=212667 RepID=UPI00406816F6
MTQNQQCGNILHISSNSTKINPVHVISKEYKQLSQIEKSKFDKVQLGAIGLPSRLLSVADSKRLYTLEDLFNYGFERIADLPNIGKGTFESLIGNVALVMSVVKAGVVPQHFYSRSLPTQFVSCKLLSGSCGGTPCKIIKALFKEILTHTAYSDSCAATLTNYYGIICEDESPKTLSFIANSLDVSFQAVEQRLNKALKQIWSLMFEFEQIDQLYLSDEAIEFFFSWSESFDVLNLPVVLTDTCIKERFGFVSDGFVSSGYCELFMATLGYRFSKLPKGVENRKKCFWYRNKEIASHKLSKVRTFITTYLEDNHTASIQELASSIAEEFNLDFSNESITAIVRTLRKFEINGGVVLPSFSSLSHLSQAYVVLSGLKKENYRKSMIVQMVNKRRTELGLEGIKTIELQKDGRFKGSQSGFWSLTEWDLEKIPSVIESILKHLSVNKMGLTYKELEALVRSDIPTITPQSLSANVSRSNKVKTIITLEKRKLVVTC